MTIRLATEISGLFSGQLDFITNKKDADFNVALYELMPTGEYFQTVVLHGACQLRSGQKPPPIAGTGQAAAAYLQVWKTDEP